MSIEIVFETHSLSEDNEVGLASGWTHGPLSAQGRELARELGARRRDNGIHTVFSSDLHRALETAMLAFEGLPFPILLDWRLRECDYGDLTRVPASELHVRPRLGTSTSRIPTARAGGRRSRASGGSSPTCRRVGTAGGCS